MSSGVGPGGIEPDQDLAGRTILVLGATGGVGEGVVRHLLDAGATVIASSRDEGRATAFAERVAHSRLHPVALDAMSKGFTSDIAWIVQRYGLLDGAVVSIASWGAQGRKPLLALSDDEWNALVAENQTAVFRAFRTLYPAVSPSGALVQLNGMSADIPFPGAGGVALAAAATKSMTRTMAAETSGRGPRIYEIVLGMVRTRARQLAGIDDERWIDAASIGKHIAGLVTGAGALSSTVLHYFVDQATGPQPGEPGN